MKKSRTKTASARRRTRERAAKPRRQLRVAHGEGREALLEAVVRAVAHHGPDGFSYRSLAREAGLTHGLVHYYFGSRDAFLEAAYRWAVQTEIRQMHLRPAGEWIREFRDSLLNLSTPDRDAHLFLNEMVLDACRRKRRRKSVQQTFLDVFETVQEALKSLDVPANPALARVFFGALAGMTIQHMVFDSPEMTREYAAELEKIVEALRRAG
jgi:AcrR family transcriptional regulator